MKKKAGWPTPPFAVHRAVVAGPSNPSHPSERYWCRKKEGKRPRRIASHGFSPIRVFFCASYRIDSITTTSPVGVPTTHLNSLALGHVFAPRFATLHNLDDPRVARLIEADAFAVGSQQPERRCRRCHGAVQRLISL